MGIERIYHVGVNCTDMQKSMEFYSGHLGLDATPVTIPGHLREYYDPALKKILGLDETGKVDFEPYFLTGNEAENATYIDFIQWNSPKSFGQPYASLNHLGIARVALLVDDIDAMYDRLVSSGIKCISEPKTVTAKPSGAQFRCLAFRDPDGTVMEFVQTELPTHADAQPGARRLFHVNINCSDLKRSAEFYGNILGLDMCLQTGFYDSPELGALLDLGAQASAELCMFATKQGVEGTVIDLVEWKKPRFTGKPYDKLNHLGIPRMAFLVDDVDGMYEELLLKNVKFISDPVTIQFDPPVGKIRAVCFYDPDSTVLEFLELNYTG